MQWDLFCRVVDNLGDVGVCWRLAADLGARGDAVRLWLDDASALPWMAPRGAPGVSVHAWAEAESEAAPADVVVEAFGCELPAAFVARMAARGVAPRWINLEYLSAEAYVERSHRLPSPQMSGPGRGLLKHFFYPGFTPATGGLLREPGLVAAREAFDRDDWLARHGWPRRREEQVAFLFCYPDSPLLPALLQALAALGPTLLLVAAGAAQAQVRALPALPPGLRSVALPWLDQPGFDRAMWCADWLFVRGEDSFVRAQWAGAPFVWQIYRQHDGAHAAKLDAFLQRHLAGAPDALAGPLRQLWLAWNGLDAAAPPLDAAAWPDATAWRSTCRRWRDGLLAQDDLATQLRGFAVERR